MAPIPELSVLKARSPSLRDSDDWPAFILTNVEVFDGESRAACSLLAANADNPLIVQGKLAKLSKDRRQFLENRKLADSLPMTILVDDVMTFSYGQNDEGEVLLWAAGAAGWYEIRPARTYEEIYKEDCAAVNALYFLTDLYHEAKARHRALNRVTLESIFAQYAEKWPNTCSNGDEAAAIFEKHRHFLLDCMEKGREEINWKQTSIFSYLRQEPEDTIMTSMDEAQTSSRELKRDPRSRHAGKGRSSLRPRGMKRSSKGIASKTQPTSDEELDSTSSTPLITSPSASLKRKRPRGRPRKVDDDGGSSETETENEDAEAETEVSLPLNRRAATKAANAKRLTNPVLKITKRTLPSFSPTGPGDSWLCSFDGCSHIIYAASKPESKALIKDHFQKHATDSQTQLDLIYSEKRPYLPVNNLVNKIREMAAKKQTDPSTGPSVGGLEMFFPKPIERKF